MPVPQAHPIQPYAQALEKEHQEALVGGRPQSLVGLLANQARASAQTGRVVIVRHAGPAEPFRSQ
ncbi:MAG: hypothetical protein K1X78_19415 [Verrucomicrobiaceae bacterium]|nr:hypothetical protein [Verrucomicrobiaceae bacterium]